MEKIKIYAPADGEIDLIENLNDGVFSEKMLGDGFFIKAIKKSFYSPIDSGKLNLITDTKHAFFFEKDNINILMHIGLDTVNLNGIPFNVKVNLNQEVSIKTEIVEVDLDMIEKSGLSSACPITIDSGDKKYKFNLLTKSKKVKQGDLVGEFELLKDKIAPKKSEDYKTLFLGGDSYKNVARQINILVGGKNNYDDVFNCMTRLRFTIKDVKKVDQDAIKKVDMVKGLIWAGKQLQVIIGQDVYKVKDQVIVLNEQGDGNFEMIAEEQLPLFKRFLKMFLSIMPALIPIFIGFGLFQAILGILSYQELGIIPPGVMDGEFGPKDSIWIVLLNVVSKSSTVFLGVAVAYSAGNYFKYNLPVSIAIGLVLSSPFFFGNGALGGLGNNWIFGEIETHTGIDVIDGMKNQTGNWIIPPMLSYVIGPQNLNIFVVIGTVFLAKKVDNWVVSWIPPQIELTFRWFIDAAFALIPAFLLFAPMWFWISKILGIMFYYLLKIPGGIGAGIYSMIWQPAVVFGVHYAIGMLTMTDSLANGGFSNFNPGTYISTWGQVGAVIGVMLITKNSMTKRDAVGFATAGVFGITEPLLYGINVPKKRPLYAGAFASLIGGIVAGLVGVTSRVSSGLGIFALIGDFSNSSSYNTNYWEVGALPGLENGLWSIACNAIAFVTAIALTMLVYRERVTEKKQLIANDKLFVKYLLANKLINQEQAQTLSNNLIEINSLISKEDELKLKQIEKRYQKINIVLDKISNADKKMALYKDKIVLKGKKLLDNDEDKKAQELFSKYDVSEYLSKIDSYKKELEILQKEVNDDFLYEMQQKISIKYQNLIKTMNFIQKDKKELILNKYKGILNSLRVVYKLDDESKNQIDFSKELAKLKAEQKMTKRTS